MERVLHEEPERLKKLAPSVPRDLETIIAKATARDPAGRYATAAALAEDLRRYVEDRPIRARRMSAAERLARWCRRNKGLAASIGVAAAALVAWPRCRCSMPSGRRQANRRIERMARLERRRTLEEREWSSQNRTGRVEPPAGNAQSRAWPRRVREGAIGLGMLWTVESLRMATEAGDEAGQHVALANLSAWRRHHVELKGVFSHGERGDGGRFSPDGKTIVTGSDDKTARLWDATTGRPLGQPMEHPDGVAFRGVRPRWQDDRDR